MVKNFVGDCLMQDKIFIIDDADNLSRIELDTARDMFRWWRVKSVEPLSGDDVAESSEKFARMLVRFCGDDVVKIEGGVITVKNGAARKYAATVLEIMKLDLNDVSSGYFANPGARKELEKILFPNIDILVVYHRIPMDFEYFIRVVSDGDDGERRIVVSNVFGYKKII